MSGDDQQGRYRQMGYQIVGDGAVEFYYVAFCTHKQTRQREHCLNGLFPWSNKPHDPSRTIQNMPKKDNACRCSRPGPFPNVRRYVS